GQHDGAKPPRWQRHGHVLAGLKDRLARRQAFERERVAGAVSRVDLRLGAGVLVAGQGAAEPVVRPSQAEQERAPRSLFLLGRKDIDDDLAEPQFGTRQADDLLSARPFRAVLLRWSGEAKPAQDQVIA